MRVHTRGIGPAGEDGSIDVDGQTVPTSATDTVASAMVAAGVRGFREADHDEKRGLWCGMGVCHECTVSIEGNGGSLACMTPATDGARVTTQPLRPAVGSSPPSAATEESELSPDVLVIGAGPAGLAAANDLARRGLDVVVVDDRSSLGGQYYKQPNKAFDLDEGALDEQYRAGRRLIDEATSSPAKILLGVTVWGAFGVDYLLARSATHRWTLRPRRLVIAAGAYERGVPMPGWTLPGVMTTGAGQTLLRSYQVSPGSRVLVAGNGPLNIQFAAELARAGVEVVALVEAAPIRSLSRGGAVARMALAAPGLMASGARYLTSLGARRVPVLTGSVVTRLEGDPADGVTRTVVARLDADGTTRGPERVFEVDAVCLGYGFIPSSDLARSLGCRHDIDADRAALVAVTDPSGRSSNPRVWVVGDSARVLGAAYAQVQGRLAAAAIADDLGAVGSRTDGSGLQAQARRQQCFQAAMLHLFSAPVLTDQLATPDTVVCRCEGITYGEIRSGLGDGVGTSGSLKRTTRVGMGKCQGRYCGPVVNAMSAEASGSPVGEFSGFAPQAPVKPVSINDMAAPPDALPR